MEPQETKKESKKRRSHKWLWGLAIIAVAGLLLLLLLPYLLSTSGGTQFLENRISSAVDGEVKMGSLSLGWFSGVRVNDFVFEGPEGATRVRVDRITSKPQLFRLLLGRLALRDTVIDRPDVHLTVTQEGEIKGLGRAGDEEKKRPSSQKMEIGPLDLKVNDGRALIRQAMGGDRYRPVEFRNIASTVNLPSGGGTSNASLSMAVAADGKEGTVEANGRMQSQRGGFSLEGLSGQFEVEVNALALESLAPLLAIAGVQIEDLAGTVNVAAQLRLDDGSLESLIADARVENFRQTVGGETIALQEPIIAQARIVTENGNYQVEQLRIESAFLTLTGTGGVNRFDYNLNADLARTQAVVGPLLGLDYSLRGDLSGSGVIRMTDEGIVSSGQMQAQQFAMAKEDKQLGPTPLELAYEATVDTNRSQSQIASASIRFAPGYLVLRNSSVNWGGEHLRADVQLGGQINLQQARPYVNFFYALPEDITMAGTVRPDLRVRMEDDRLIAEAGNTRIENLQISQPNAEPFVSKEAAIGGRAVLDLKNNRLESLEDFSVTGDRINIKGSLERRTQEKNAQVSGHVQADYELQAVGNLLSPFLPQQLRLAGRRQDFFDFMSVYPQDQPEKLLANLNGTGKFGFDSAEFMGLRFGKADFNITAKSGLLSLNLPETPVNDGTLQFAGNINLAEEPKFLRLEKAMPILTNVQINDEMSNALLKYVNPTFANSVAVTGAANLVCQQMALPLGGANPKQMLMVEGTLWIERLNMQAGSFLGTLLQAARSPTSARMTLQKTPFVVKDGVLHYERMELIVENRPFVFAGDIGIATDRLNMTVQLPITARGETIRVGEQNAGVPLAAGITGTPNGPRLDMRQTIESGVEGLIRGGLEQLLEKNRR